MHHTKQRDHYSWRCKNIFKMNSWMSIIKPRKCSLMTCKKIISKRHLPRFESSSLRRMHFFFKALISSSLDKLNFRLSCSARKVTWKMQKSSSAHIQKIKTREHLLLLTARMNEGGPQKEAKATCEKWFIGSHTTRMKR